MLRKLSVLVLVVWGIKLGLKSAMIDHAKSIERRDLFLGTMPSTYYSMVGVCGCKERTPVSSAPCNYICSGHR